MSEVERNVFKLVFDFLFGYQVASKKIVPKVKPKRLLKQAHFQTTTISWSSSKNNNNKSNKICFISEFSFLHFKNPLSDPKKCNIIPLCVKSGTETIFCDSNLWYSFLNFRISGCRMITFIAWASFVLTRKMLPKGKNQYGNYLGTRWRKVIILRQLKY